MRVRPTRIPDVLLLEPRVHRDARGFFLETYHRPRFREAGIDAIFVQDNHSCSSAGTLRGLHAQLHHPQGKLVRVVAGAVFDVAVDLRPGSPTFGAWVGERLTHENFRQLWIPPGFAHGFCVLGDAEAQVEYKCTHVYLPDDEIGVRWDDPELGIDWPVENPRLSERDRRLPTLAEVRKALHAAADRSRSDPSAR